MGVPCATLPAADMRRLMSAVEALPGEPLALDIKEKTLTAGGETYSLSIPEGNRIQLLEGAWDATGMLMEARDAVAAVAARLPYVAGF